MTVAWRCWDGVGGGTDEAWEEGRSGMKKRVGLDRQLRPIRRDALQGLIVGTVIAIATLALFVLG
jgi:hypothetical protein